MTMTESASADRTLLDHVFRQLVDGQLLEGASSAPVLDPATGKEVGRAPVADTGQVDAAVAAAKAAFPWWRDTPIEIRTGIVRQVADALEARHEEFARTIVLENGKPLAEARVEVDLALMWARYGAGMSLPNKVVRDDPESFVEVRRKPIGVVAAIVPWNFPLFQMMYKMVPAMVSGNTVIVKPAPTTPLTAMLFAEILVDLVPPGVVNVLGDGGDVGPQLTGHADVGKVSFTGSTAVGKRVMSRAAETLKRTVLELGGNDAALVLDDANVQKVAASIFACAFAGSGQVCVSVKRIYVPDALYEAFCEEFARLAGDAVVGHGLDPATTMGPVQNARQFALVKEYLRLAKADGRVIAGGETIAGSGYFVQPTVVRDVDQDSLLVREETFGPIRTILSYSNLEDAIRRVNDTDYGLGNSVWSEDEVRATEVADQLESGTTWVNTHMVPGPDIPFGGRKHSGLGVEYAQEGLEEYTDVQVINVARQ